MPSTQTSAESARFNLRTSAEAKALIEPLENPPEPTQALVDLMRPQS